MNFKDISIRGRFGYCLKCLDNYLFHFKMRNEISGLIIKKYSEFTLAENLSDWYVQAKEFSPEFYETYQKKTSQNCKNLAIETALKIKEYFAGLNQECLSLYSNTFDIGIEHLYSIINSDETILLLKESLEILANSNVLLPDFKKIEDSSFGENRGWGKRFEGDKIWL